MNSIVLMAEMMTDPELRYTPDNLAVSSMQVQFPSNRSDEAPYRVQVSVFGELAQSVVESCHRGDHVTIEGQLHMNTVDRDGRKEKLAEITARRIYSTRATMAESIGPAATTGSSSTSESAPTSAPASTPAPAPRSYTPTPTPSPEPNLDDIPF